MLILNVNWIKLMIKIKQLTVILKFKYKIN
jgi:hypothetical protein